MIWRWMTRKCVWDEKTTLGQYRRYQSWDSLREYISKEILSNPAVSSSVVWTSNCTVPQFWPLNRRAQRFAANRTKCSEKPKSPTWTAWHHSWGNFPVRQMLTTSVCFPEGYTIIHIEWTCFRTHQSCDVDIAKDTKSNMAACSWLLVFEKL